MKPIPEFRADMGHAYEIAELVISGAMTPRQACARLAEISSALRSPGALSLFELLNHEQYGHENLGITAESIAPEIIEACKELVARS